MLTHASADRKEPYWEMWKLEVCFYLQPAAGSSAAASHSCITIGCSVASAARSGLIRRALVSRPGYPVSKASTVAMREAQPSSAGSVLLR